MAMRLPLGVVTKSMKLKDYKKKVLCLAFSEGCSSDEESIEKEKGLHIVWLRFWDY